MNQNMDQGFDMKSMIMNLLPMGVIFGLQALKLDYTDPNIIFMFRAIYAAGMVFYLGICGLIFMNLKKNSKSLQFVLSYAEKYTPMEFNRVKTEYEALGAKEKKEAGEPSEYYMVEETVMDHDMKQLKSLVTRTLQGALITVGIHWYWGFMPPLVIQTVLPLIKLVDNQLVQIHFLGNTTIKRPFREEPGLMSKLTGDNPNTKLEEFERKHKRAHRN